MRLCALLPLLALTACGARSSFSGSGTIDGYVYLTAPVGGAVVSAYPLDLQTGKTVARKLKFPTTITAPDGAFHLDVGSYFGPLLLVARGGNASYLDPVTGRAVVVDEAQELRAVFFTTQDGAHLTLNLAQGAHPSEVLINPWTELTMAATLGKISQSEQGAPFSDVFSLMTTVFREHTEVEYWHLRPTPLDAKHPKEWSAAIQFGLEAAGLSELAQRMDGDSGVGDITALQLVRMLERDAQDGIFDGRDPAGPLQLGSCTAECAMSTQTLRSDWVDSMARFVKVNLNISTPSIDRDAFFVRVAERHSFLFLDSSSSPYDVTPPTLKTVEGSVIDQPGAQMISLVGDQTAEFQRYSTDYGPTDAGIPTWRFLVEDDLTSAADLDVRARVLLPGVGWITDWITVPYAPAGEGWNRELSISGALDSRIATTTGRLMLAVQATDRKGNTSPQTWFSWFQFILRPRTPSVVLLPTPVGDESSVAATVSGEGTGVAIYTGTPATIVIDGKSIPKFARYASHYGPKDAGIPHVRLLVTPGRPANHITVSARLLRDETGEQIVPWFEVSAVDGKGYNREVVLSNVLSWTLGHLSGTYRLELRVADLTDAVETKTSVAWTQTILTPPVRQRSAPACESTDPQCPTYYSLASEHSAIAAIKGGPGLTGGLKLGHSFIDNPNSVPVRVHFSTREVLSYQRGRKHLTAPVTPFPFKAGCEPTQTADGSCYLPPISTGEALDGGELEASTDDPEIGVLNQGMPLPPCSTCSPGEVEIPANTTVEVWFYADPFSFLWGPYPLELHSPGLPEAVLGGPCETYVDRSGGGQAFYQVHWYLTRLWVSPAITATLTTRVADPRAVSTLGPGVGVNQFVVPAIDWKTSAPGELSF